ncbi:hypothetical protein [Burkholderia mayonis]|nr:hypothetical protein [Burkholderia mayonis]
MAKGLITSFIGMFVMSCSGCGGGDSSDSSPPAYVTTVTTAPSIPQPSLPALTILPPGPELSFLPVFVHFFDWFKSDVWNESNFVDHIDWSKIGINESDRSSEDFYYKQFQYIRSLGIDAIAWEYNIQAAGEPTYPGKEAIRALRRSGLKIAPFYDWEICAKARDIAQRPALPILSNANSIKPDITTADIMSGDLRSFFGHVPSDLLAHDKKGRQVIFVFGYGFDDSNPNPEAWDGFANRLEASTSKMAGVHTTFYWTSANSIFEQHLFQHHRDSFVPFQFVLDTPQSQYGHDSVTWNFGFDNLGVQKRDGLQRVVRLDKRYVEEMGWLSKATDPSLVFIYSWNEPFEGSMLIPTEHWDDTKARLAKEFIQRLRSSTEASMPRTLLIVDDLADNWSTRKGDWHLTILREMLHYSMRRFAPQSDVRVPAEITPELLDKYPYIIDASSQKSTDVSKWLMQRMDTHYIMVFDPLASTTGDPLAANFGRLDQSPNINGEVEFVGVPGTLFVRDDVNQVRACSECKVSLSIDLPSSTSATPLVVQKSNDVWVNAYTSDERVLAPAFEAFYGHPMDISIMYGEGFASQRLEIDAKTKKVTYNRLERKSVDGHWEIPAEIDWYRMPPEVNENDYKFIFGLD